MPSPPFLPAVSPFYFRPSSLDHLKQIHAQLITGGHKPPSILAALIQQYLHLSPRSGPKYARPIVEHETGEKPFLLNTLIRCSRPRDSILLFAHWVSKSTVEFDDHTYIFALGACARSLAKSAVCEGKQIHARLVKNGLMSDLVVATTAIHFYGSNANLGPARQVFDEMPDRNSAAWNALIKGYCNCSQEVSSDKNAREGYMLFKEMLADEGGVQPTDTTMVCVLSSASQLRLLEIGASLHGYVEKTIDAAEDDVYLGTALLEMYSKCGCLGNALTLFHRMQEADVFTWTTMMTGLVAHGRGSEALDLLDEMTGSNIMPNVVTFTSLISACCRAGLVDECLHLFHIMEGNKFRVKPNIQHYRCIVDLLCRVGRLEEAYGVITRMPSQSKPASWRSLLVACRFRGNEELGKKVANVLRVAY